MNLRRLVVVALLAGLAAAMSAVRPGRAAGEAAATIDTKESDWDVFVDNQKAGRVHLKTMAIRDLVIIEENFSVTLKGKETSFANQIVYKTGNPPRPTRGKATTRLGPLKLMEGTAVFSEASVKTEISGFTDKDLKPLATPLTETKDTPLPPGLVLTYPALMYFAPKLMPDTGQMPKVAYLEFPSGVAFPEFVFAVPDCVLVRGPVGADGRVEFSLRRVFAGGNIENLVAMTVDKKGDITEVRLRPFSLRPASAAPAPAAAPKAGKK
ncbi:MAG: hypothetical protein NTY65_09625 [Planctomycetota bacterium]|nr:hypothetical protein [Planctomycetota bacterium]